MTRKRRAATLMALLSLLAMVGCGAGEPQPAATTAGKPVVYAVNYPLQYFAQRIAGDEAEIRFPVPSDEDPAFWRPNADEIVAFQSADMVLLNGAGYAKWVATASLPASKTVDTAASFDDELIHVEASATHSHGLTGEHSHAGTAFTTWLDLHLAIAHAQAIHDALAGLLPGKEAALASNLEALKGDLNEIDERMLALGRTIGDRPLVASHPVYQYWARRYGLNLISVMWEPDEVPSTEALRGLQSILADHSATLMIWEGEPDPRSVERLEALGVRSVVFDPCGNAPGTGDFLLAMRVNLEALRTVIASREG